MIPRRAPILLMVLVAMVGVIAAGRDRPAATSGAFSRLPLPSMPFVPTGSFVTGSWFCPGVPATGDQGVGGVFTITNPGESTLQGRVTLLSTSRDVAPITDPFTVAARSTTSIDATAKIRADMVSALIEIDGGGGVVEQRAVHPAGQSVAPCSNATSGTWYFADGFTVDDSSEAIVITNPYPDAAVVDIKLATRDVSRTPEAFQGKPVPGRSVMTIPIAELGVRDEPIIAVEVVASGSRVVAGRAQHYLGGGRLGYTMTLGAPSLDEQWFFADGGTGPGIAERFSIYNPTDADVEVDVAFLGVPVSAEFANSLTVAVPADGVAVVDAAEVPGLPDGRHGAVFSTLTSRSIVVERALTRGTGRDAATSVVLGAPATHAATRWHLPSGVAGPTTDAIVVNNVGTAEALITVSAVGPAGEVPVAGYEAVPVAPSSVVALPFDDAGALGDPLVVTATQPVYVERALGRAGGSTSFGLPQ